MKDSTLLTDSDSFYRTLVDSFDVGLFSCDIQGNIFFFNEKAEKLWGQEPSDRVKFFGFYRAWYPDGSAVNPENSPVAQSIREGRPRWNVEMWAERPDGSKFYASLSTELLRDSQGKLLGAVGMIRDITDDMASAKNFLAGEVRYRKFLQTLPVATYLCDNTGRITLFNDAAVRQWGREPDSGDRWSGAWKMYAVDGKSISPQDFPLARTVEEGHPENGAVVIMEKPDGTKSWILVQAGIMPGPTGKPEGGIAMLIDVTNGKESEHNLEEIVEGLRMAVDAAEMGTWEMDLATGLTLTSERHRNIMGYSQDSAWTRDQYLARVHSEDLDRVQKEFDKAIESGKLFYEARIVRPEGNVRWIRVNGITIYSHGTPVRMLGTIVDITEQRAASEDLEKTVAIGTKQLRRLNKQLEKSNHELEQFAYIASHDLQEPLRKIQTFTTLVENVDGESARRKYLNKIREEAQGMSALVRDVLMFSRLSAIPEFDSVDLNQIVDDMKAELTTIIAEKKATITAGQLPMVMGIPRQLTQLISNIVHNSLKFCTAAPDIRITARPPSVNDRQMHPRLRSDREYIILAIQDNGIGFDEKYSEQIFQIFQRLNPREAYPGNGIGLALCKKIVENHHGAISASSAPGIGTTISIILPAPRP